MPSVRDGRRSRSEITEEIRRFRDDLTASLKRLEEPPVDRPLRPEGSARSSAEGMSPEEKLLRQIFGEKEQQAPAYGASEVEAQEAHEIDPVLDAILSAQLEGVTAYVDSVNHKVERYLARD